jgi:nitrogen fixation/metabolism regulation signal transduction histidine kinase
MRLQTKFLLAFAAFFALAFGCMLFFSLHAQRSAMEIVTKDIQNILQTVQFSSQDISAEHSPDREALTRIIEEAKSNPSVKEVSIVSSNQEVVASSNPAKIGKHKTLTGKEIIVRERFGAHDSTGRHLRYEVTTPIVRDKKVIGLVETSFIMNDFTDLLHKLYQRNFYLASGAFLALFLTSFIVLRGLIAPIRRLNTAAMSIASGDLSVRVEQTSNDEIGRLTATFNQMTTKLHELKDLEEKLRILDRRAVLSETAATLAHEIRNPLNLINLTADHLAHSYRPEEAKQREAYESMIASLKAEVRHLNTMVEEFMAIGKPIRIKKAVFPFNDMLSQVKLLINQQLVAKQLSIRYDQTRQFNLYADQEQLRLVFLNLLLNAIDASPSGGAISLSLTKEEHCTRISIVDQGHGIDPAFIEKIFEPYFSKRPDGVGLGLAMAKRIIEAHNGTIIAHNGDATEKNGACFEIRLPDKDTVV